jgi:hypothetical protein
MFSKKTDLAIINRSFWPIYPVIGEALLKLAEKAAADGVNVSVITQDHVGLKTKLKNHKRGEGVNFSPCMALSNSASGILVRVLDAVFFMGWVAFSLLRLRPKKVYISTDPPVLVPFVVMLYAKLFRAEYVYHLQDIHPEATRVIVPVNRFVFFLTKWMDVQVIKNANTLITLTQQMADEVCYRVGNNLPVNILENPAVSFEGIKIPKEKSLGFVFCGSVGRLQRIPLLIDAMVEYFSCQGKLKFEFAGGGFYSKQLESLQQRFPERFIYHGQISPKSAANLNAKYEWALLPIEDEVTRFAFPSKTSSYVFSGASLLAVCGAGNSVAEWVTDNDLGIVCEPSVEALVEMFQRIEHSEVNLTSSDSSRNELKQKLEFGVFISKMQELTYQ